MPQPEVKTRRRSDAIGAGQQISEVVQKSPDAAFLDKNDIPPFEGNVRFLTGGHFFYVQV